MASVGDSITGEAPPCPAESGGTDAASLAKAFADHQGYLKRYLSRRLAPGQDADDVAQEVYIRALKFARRENKISNWRGILTRIAAGLVVDGFRRRRARAHDLHDPLDLVQDPGDHGVNSPERILEGRQAIRDVEATLASLDPDSRRAFELVRFHGYSYAEAARRLQTDPVQIGRMIERATLRLAKAAIGSR